jgi:hypothetical protein
VRPCGHAVPVSSRPGLCRSPALTCPCAARSPRRRGSRGSTTRRSRSTATDSHPCAPRYELVNLQAASLNDNKTPASALMELIRGQGARGASSGAEAAFGTEGRLDGHPLAPHGHGRRCGRRVARPPPRVTRRAPHGRYARSCCLRVSKASLRMRPCPSASWRAIYRLTSSNEASGWFSRRNSAKSGTVKSSWPRRGLQMRPFWISDSRKTETPRASLAP